MRIKANIALSETGFVFNPNTGESFTLNPAGMEIFELIRQEKTQAHILKSMLGKYDIDRDMVEKDLDDFIHYLGKYQILDTDE